MAMAAVRVDDLERGDLPAICAKTGAPCVGPVKDTLQVVPRWVSPLAAFFVFPYYVGRMFTARRIEATIPVARGRVEGIRRLVHAAWIALVVAAAGLAAAIFAKGAVGVVELILGLVAYLLIMYVGDQLWVGARPSHRADVVILTRVHPEFVQALGDLYDERAAGDSPLALPADY